MAQYPAFPLWTDAYLADTTHLTATEHGVYMLLLITMWRAGGTLPNDDKALARYGRVTLGQWQRMKPTIMPFFRVSSDSITQGRLTDELSFVKRKSRKQSDKANARWLKNNDAADAAAMPDECQIDAAAMPDACPHTHTHLEEDKSSSFSPAKQVKEGSKSKVVDEIEQEFSNEFWPAYPRKIDRKDALKAFRKARATVDLAVIMAALKAYCAEIDGKDKQYVRHGARWLNATPWEDGAAENFSAAPKVITDDDWQKRLKYGRDNRQWHVGAWGPFPHAADCRVPEHLLQPSDGQGWAVWEA